MNEMTTGDAPNVKIARRAADRLRDGHVWVYRSDLADAEQMLPFGGLVHVLSEKGRFLGSALASSASQIALRMISIHAISEGEMLSELLRQRVRNAIAYRRRFAADSDAYRLVFSDADGLPGLIVDRYADVLTMQALTQAMDRADLRAVVIETLQSELGIENIVERADTQSKMREREQLPAIESRQICGDKSETVFRMNGLAFAFDALGGQKTGAFLDQRQNYAAAEKYARGRALDICTYQGGFALHLARVCAAVAAVDVSRAALEVADQNARRNQPQLRCEIEWLQANAFDALRDWSDSGEKYDTIVLDPPAFAKTRRKSEEALKGYKELNLRALKMLASGGVLVTCSCSHHVAEADFLLMLLAAANDAKRRLRILERRTQAVDHPVLLGVPETQYLKCIIALVE
ncbi:MAG: class I SAM-dependent rRNA methyltransferase [Acidobacteriaceae bacterium]